VRNCAQSRSKGRLFPSCERSFQPQDSVVQETELAREPRQPVDKNQAANEKQERAAEEFDGVEMLSEALVKTEKLADAECGEKEGNGEAGRIDGKKKDAACDGVTGSGKGEDAGEDRANAGSPTESEGKAEKKAAPEAGLLPGIAEMNVAIEPASEGRAEEADDGKREKVNLSEAGEERPAVEESDDPKRREKRAKDDADARFEASQSADEMQAEEKDQGAGDGSEERAVLEKKVADRAGGSAEGNKDDGETENKGERGSEEASARRLALAQLLHADAGEHGDVTGNKRKHAGREKRNQAGDEGCCERDVAHIV